MSKHARSAAAAAAIVVAATLVGAAPAAAQTHWSWDGPIAAGQTLHIVGIEGSIRARLATGARPRVEAVKTARDGDPDAVRLAVVEHEGGVTICALYPSREGRPAGECRAGGGVQNNGGNARVRVDFDVELPAGVHFAASNVSGNIRVSDATGDVRATTVSGNVTITTAGVARATTVSGDIDVDMGRVPDSGLSFTTVSGDIVARITSELHADIRFSTVSGRIESDYPISMVSGGGRGGFRGTIGEGGRTVRFTTVSGDIALRRR